jgi:hypothetical protein
MRRINQIPIGQAKIVQYVEGKNEPFCDGIEVGEYYVIVRVDEDSWFDYPLIEQPIIWMKGMRR